MAIYFAGTLRGNKITITNDQERRVNQVGRTYGANGSPIIFKTLQNNTKLLVSFDGAFDPKEITYTLVANELGPDIQATDIVWDE